MMLVLVSGFVFDIVGRRKTLFTCFLVSGISAIITPFTSPNVYPFLLIVRIIFSMSVMPIQANPLVNDYVAPESRGQGFSVMYLG
jgi:MFS family permease